MNTEQELLTILMEECGEVIQAASKIIRFGGDNDYNGETGYQILERELGDLQCIVGLLQDEGRVHPEALNTYAGQKFAKLQKWSTLFNDIQQKDLFDLQ